MPEQDQTPTPPQTLEDCNTMLTSEIAKSRRPAALIAAFGLVGVTSGAVGGIVYNLAVNGGSESITILGTLATLGVGGLLALAGAKEK